MAEFAAIATVASAVLTGAKALGVFGKDASPPPPPAAPEMPPAMNTPQVDQGALDARRRAAAAGGIMANINTGPGGITGGASTTGKILLGS